MSAAQQKIEQARAALEARGIPVRTLKEDPDVLRNITPAAEHSFALLTKSTSYPIL